LLVAKDWRFFQHRVTMKTGNDQCSCAPEEVRGTGLFLRFVASESYDGAVKSSNPDKVAAVNFERVYPK
jgi:hypothetical protein